MGKIRSTNEPAWTPDAAYAIPRPIADVLENWGRWAAPRFGISPHTHYMFRGSKSGTRGDILGMGAPAVLVQVDPAQAWRMELVICSADFLPQWRQLLVAHYAFSADPRSTCRTLELQRGDYDHQVHDASFYAHGRFERAGPSQKTVCVAMDTSLNFGPNN
ncbi:hypothetical protein ACG02S_07860 [Roseateles sp. DC23W]|uniref:Activator of Hsp90 ATPase homolog 1-like protein n=1 Tax=Pelomonas dachongensis TaxID=3299029 RepID=A0ABW7ELQ8_9BURK